VPALTLLVTGDPAASYLKPLEKLPADTNLIITEDLQELRQIAPKADVILNGDFRDPRPFLEIFSLAKRVRWIHSPAAGVDKVLSPEIIASPVPLTNGAGVFARPLAEWVIGMMVYFSYDMPRVLRNQAARRWDSFEHAELHGQTLGIVGYGGIGRALGERAQPFGMKILPLRRKDAPRRNGVLAQCDYIAITAPLTAETRGMIGAEQFAVMKPSAVIINVGRGPVIDERALIGALESGKIRGAAMDVFATEPLPPEHPFWAMENVVVSPHTADNLPDSREQAIQFFVENFGRFVKGEPLENVVDKHAGY
jgi:phosphoglycerate dehydrogenase-like enzyme